MQTACSGTLNSDAGRTARWDRPLSSALRQKTQGDGLTAGGATGLGNLNEANVGLLLIRVKAQSCAYLEEHQRQRQVQWKIFQQVIREEAVTACGSGVGRAVARARGKEEFISYKSHGILDPQGLERSCTPTRLSASVKDCNHKAFIPWDFHHFFDVNFCAVG